LPLVLAIACGGGDGAKDPGKVTPGTTVKVSDAAKKYHNNALEEFQKHDKAFDWSEESCRAVAKKFVEASEAQASETGAGLPSSLYNAGVALMRCDLEEEAVQQFQKTTAVDSSFHRGRAQVTLFEYKRTGDLDGTISELEGIIRDAKFQNVEALIAVAALQMERDSDQATDDGANDFDRAKKNIQRALAIDDTFMPAFNQLATYYMETAKKNAGGRKGRRRGLVVAGAKKTKVNQQQLELAALVASQAIMKNGNYAPIHNTAGLIQVQMNNYNGAVKSFARARQLDPKFFEAHMNYAALNLSFRGFKEAEVAYKEALKLRPKEYEAHLGLGLAIRGQIDDANFDSYVAAAQESLNKCKEIDSSRPEAFYNEAILTQEYRAKAGGDPLKSIPTLKEAIVQYESFISKAGSEPVFAEAVKRSEDRVQDIKDTITFVEEGEKARVEQEKLDAQMAAEEEARKKAEAEAAKAEAEAAKAEADKKKAEDDAAKKEPAPGADGAKPAPAAPKK
jgi:tetratricopeptide (TPR) repeat protein